jgi:hypothetical protein
MFIGHFAVAFAAKPAAPRASLGTLFIACALVDLVWPVMLLIGLETVVIRPSYTPFTPLEFEHYPWTHSLAMCAAWSLAFAGLYWLVCRDLRAALAAGAVVLSHWFLDAVVHVRDLPLVPGGATRVGLGLWHSIPATLALEGLLFAAGLALYLRATRARDRAGSWGFWLLVLFFLLAYAGAAFGPPPPSVEAVAWAGILGGLVTGAWGYWIERHRAGRG